MTIDDVPEEWEPYIRGMLLADLGFFTRYFFYKTTGKKFIVAAHHTRIFEALTRVVRGECKRLIINVPPRYGKTEIAVKMFFAWAMANNSAAKFIHLSYSQDLALDNSSAIRELVKSEWFQKYFPTGLKRDSDSKQKWYTTDGGGVYATSAGGAITGFGAGAIDRVYKGTTCPADGFAGAIVIDDPLKPDDAFSEVERGKINRRFTNTIASRVNGPETPIIVIMQRLHEDDMTGFLLAGGSGEEWEHLCLSAINEDDTPLWPEKHSREVLRLMEETDPYTFAGQYLQRPAPLGGGIIKGEWFKRYDMPPPIKFRTIYADTAQKTAERNDYSVFECWGKSEAGGIYLLDMIRGKWEAPELKQRAKDFWNKCKSVQGMGELREMKVEDKASGTGLIQDIRSEAMIPIAAIQRNTDKLTRVMDVVSYIKSGYVYIPENSDFGSAFIGECEAFTPNDTHAFDDQIDPLIDAIGDMLGKKGSGLLDFYKNSAANEVVKSRPLSEMLKALG